jgi:drug/metabolite transporter (DMT)-like permease
VNESLDIDPAVQPSVESRFDSVTVGTWCAVLAAFGYTASIIALRQLAKHEGLDWAIWVSCMKAVPVSLTAAAIILYRKSRGRLAWPSARIVLELLATGFFMQFFANVTFQWALSLGGMALSVSLSNAALMLTGAALGWLILKEHPTLRSTCAILLLTVAIGILSLGAEATSRHNAIQNSFWLVAITVAAAILAGFVWGLAGVIIRRVVTREVPVAVTIFLLSITGVVGLGLTTLWRMGPQWMLETTSGEFQTMMVAGGFTTIAFFAITESLRRITVVRANLLNASQIAMAAVSGVILFDERMTVGLVTGSALTVVALMMMDRPKSPNVESQAVSNQFTEDSGVSSATTKQIVNETQSPN